MTDDLAAAIRTDGFFLQPQMLIQQDVCRCLFSFSALGPEAHFGEVSSVLSTVGRKNRLDFVRLELMLKRLVCHGADVHAVIQLVEGKVPVPSEGPPDNSRDYE